MDLHIDEKPLKDGNFTYIDIRDDCNDTWCWRNGIVRSNVSDRRSAFESEKNKVLKELVEDERTDKKGKYSDDSMMKHVVLCVEMHNGSKQVTDTTGPQDGWFEFIMEREKYKRATGSGQREGESIR
ncbi:MAG: hypothetical protein Q9227_008836 [Pyrenula ochraceoflavens]